MRNKFIYSPTKSIFEKKLSAGEIAEGSIVFIEDTKEIWNRGHYFGMVGSGSGIDPNIISEIQTALAQLDADKLDSSIAESTYATSDRVTTLENYFSTAEDSDATINKWKEIVDFLEGVNEGNTVESLLAAKANQSALNDLQTSIAGLASESWVSNNFLGLGGGMITGDIALLDNTFIRHNTRDGYALLGVLDYEVLLGTEINPLRLRSNGATTINGNTLIHSGNIGSYAPIYNSAGNVGIGTTSPSYKLDVAGDIGATGTVVANNFYGQVDNTDRVGPTEQLLVLQSAGSGMIARCPGIGFHLSGYAYSTIKMRSDGSFGFYNSALTGYVDVQCHNISANQGVFSSNAWCEQLLLQGTNTNAGIKFFTNNTLEGILYASGKVIRWYTGDGDDSAIITTANIGSQSVNYANSAGYADTIDGYHISVVSSMPSSPDANTIYYVTG